jgi:glycosyltransferase involved in cell wall biosynthesis
VKVLQVLTYVSRTADFGGPLRVAVNQAEELRRRGHQVRLLAGARGYRRLPTDVDGTPATLARVHGVVPGGGVSGLANPLLLARAWRLMDWADLVHVNLPRDLVAMPVAALARSRHKPLVLQTHGMIDASDKLLARPLDALLTRRLLIGADAVLYLTGAERRDLETVAGQRLDHASRLPNGIPAAAPVEATRDDRLVLFAARLHEQKRPEIFVEAAAEVLREVDTARFVMIGPNGGRLKSVRRRIRELDLGNRVAYLGPLDNGALLRWFGTAAVYVLPSVYEPFGMTALEAMSVGTPVVVTGSCGLAPEIERAGAGAVVAPDARSLADATVRLLRDGDLRAAAGAAGRRTAQESFSISAVVDRLEVVYRSVADPRWRPALAIR